MKNVENGNRRIRPSIGVNGHEAHTRLTRSSLSDTRDIPVSNRLVIPIVFVPGIMASNLFNREINKIVWCPDNIMVMKSFIGMPNRERQIYLNSMATTVIDTNYVEKTITSDYYDDIDDIKSLAFHFHESKNILLQRGWGRIYASAYHKFMDFMQYEMSTVVTNGAISPEWMRRADLPSNGYAMSPQMTRLTDEDLKNLSRFRFEVWAFGYNWLRSNAESAKQLRAFIEGTVLPHYADNAQVRLATKKVILVTHSMGGLVARRLTLGASDLVLGVVHGSIPSNGVAEMYTNMKKGAESGIGLSSVFAAIAGPDAASMAAVLTQCQGGLELLPFGREKTYNPSPTTMRVDIPAYLEPYLEQKKSPQTWLFRGEGGKMIECSRGVDIYEKVYKCQEWYGLLPKHNEHYFDPANILQNEDPAIPPHKIFSSFISDVKNFHSSISGNYHPETYSFWGVGRDTPAIGEVLWMLQRRVRMEEYPMDGDKEYELDIGLGQYNRGSEQYTLWAVRHCGDGTVPCASWASDLTRNGMRGYCLLGASQGDPSGFVHQDAFNDARARDVSLYFLVKLVNSKLGELTK